MVGRFNRLVDPGEKLSAEVTGITGMTNERLASRVRPNIGQVLPDFFKFIEGSQYGIGYNQVAYDIPVLLEESKRAGLPGFAENLTKFKAVDIYDVARSYGIGVNSKQLRDVAEDVANLATDRTRDRIHRGFKFSHSAMGDVATTSHVLTQLTKYVSGGLQGIFESFGIKQSRWDVEFLAQKAGGQKAGAGVSFPLSATVLRGGLGLDAIKEVTKHTARYQRALVGAGAALGGAFVLSRILGKDDNYNTISGMNEYGLAARMRKSNTDFGSGYRGPVVSGQVIPPQVVSFREKWLQTQEDEDRLKAKMKASQKAYGKLDPSEIVDMGNGRSLVNISAYKPVWEDADTLLLQTPWWKFWKKDVAIRLTGIDAPEVAEHGMFDPTAWYRFREGQPRGTWATKRIREMTAGKDLRVEIASDPKAQTYGRYLGLVYNKGERKSLNLQMVEQGVVAALPFGESGSDIYPRATYLAAEQEAISAERGIWSEGFFKRYLSVSKGLGGRLTLNTLTDLSRLAKNYHLAAAQEYIWHGGDNYDEGRYLGRKLIPSYGRFFGGRGRHHNTIEGMSEQGSAGEMRKTGTDFGSGFVSPKVSGPISELLTGIRKDFMESLRTYRTTAAIAGGVGLYYGWQKGKEEGEIKWGQFASLLAMDMADDVLLFGSIQLAKKFPGAAKIGPYISHPWVKQGGMALFGFTMGKLTGEIGANLFSGKDDAYNTIEGMRHGGWAEVQRKYMTDFGSGFRAIFGKMWRQASEIGEGSVGRLRRAILEPNKILEVRANVTGMDLARKESENVWGLTIGVDPKSAGEISEGMKSLGLAGFTEKEQKLLTEFSTAHEAFEAYHTQGIMERLFHSRGNVTGGSEQVVKVFEDYFANKGIGSHISGAVVGDELLWAASHSEEMYNVVRRMRVAEMKVYAGTTYARRVGSILSSFEKKHLPRYLPKSPFALPGRGYAFNGFNGMSEGGVQEVIRHAMTPHGSKTDPIKLLAQSLGIDFGEMVRSKGFRQALRSAEKVEQIGKGQYGSVAKYKATYEGRDFFFVRKTVTEEAERKWYTSFQAKVAKHGAQPGEFEYRFYEAFHKATSPVHEGRILQKLEKAGVEVPTPYRTGKGFLDMEYIEGDTLSQILRKGEGVSTKTGRQINREINKISDAGAINLDIASRNIILRSGTREPVMIDVGVTFMAPEQTERYRQLLMRTSGNVDQQLSRILAGEEILSRSELVARAQNFKIDQRDLAAAANRGGKSHVRFQGNGKSLENTQIGHNIAIDRTKAGHVRRKRVDYPSRSQYERTKIGR